jgi:hypothetical protein
MTERRQATVCIITAGDEPERLRRCLGRLLAHTPLEKIELHLGFSSALHSLYSVVGALAEDGVMPTRHPLADRIERLQWSTGKGLSVRAWHSPSALSQDQLTRLLFHDVPLQTDYVIRLADHFEVEAGWWEALEPLLEKGVDYIGQSRWRDFLPGEAEMIQSQPWYMGVPFARREGRIGISWMTGTFLAVRSGRIKEANFPDPRAFGKADVLLGEVAHQLGWSQAVHDIRVGKAN